MIIPQELLSVMDKERHELRIIHASAENLDWTWHVALHTPGDLIVRTGSDLQGVLYELSRAVLSREERLQRLVDRWFKSNGQIQRSCARELREILAMDK